MPRIASMQRRNILYCTSFRLGDAVLMNGFDECLGSLVEPSRFSKPVPVDHQAHPKRGLLDNRSSGEVEFIVEPTIPADCGPAPKTPQQQPKRIHQWAETHR